MGCFGGCLGRTLAAALLVAIVWAAWRFGPEVAEHLPQGVSVEESLSAEAAEALGREVWAELSTWFEAGDEAFHLGSLEVEALLRHRGHQLLPPGVSGPRAQVDDGELRLSAVVARRLLPAIPEVERVDAVLPDSLRVSAQGGLLTDRLGQGVFLVRRMEVAGVPLPSRTHDALLAAVGLEVGQDLPRGAVVFPLPPGVRSLHVSGSSLILVPDR